MSVIGSNIIAGASGTVETGYQISRSLRFNSADSAYLNRTPGSAGNRRTWTWSQWFKFGLIANANYRSFIEAFTGSTDVYNTIAYENGVLKVNQDNGAGGVMLVSTPAVFRDPSAWYHLLVAVDTTQATGTNRVKIWINGVQQTLTFTTTPSQNLDTWINSANAHRMGARWGTVSSASCFDGYMADVNFIDGQALDPTSFGETDSATGVWVPKAYTGTYGTNGFWLKFDDNSGTTSTTLGKDSSGNGNNWTPNNFSVTAGAGNDSLVDSPTNYGTDTGAGGEVRGNYCTLNALDKGSSFSLTNGNLQFEKPNAAGWNTVRATIGITSGKWYWEFVSPDTLASGGVVIMVGIGKDTASLTSYLGNSAVGYAYYFNGEKWNNNSGTAYGATWSANDVIGVAFDADAGTLVFYKNGVSQGTAYTGLTSGPYFPSFSCEAQGTTGDGIANFGQRPFAYTAPSGFKALCTQNLPTPTIGTTSTTQADDYFNIALYTGTGANLSVTGIGFQPDFVWIKGRSGATDHGLYDAVRGVQKQLESNTTTAETTETTGLTAFGTDGFTVGTLAQLNTNTATYVGWAWKANGAGSTNNAGSITSTVSANQTAGISIVRWTVGSSNNQTVGHGLGVAPKFIITKNRNTAYGWACYVGALTNPQNGYLDLQTTGAFTTSSSSWNNTSPTSSVFTVGTASWWGSSTDSMIAYCFAEIEGFSKFGSYTGNGSTDGVFVYCGFRPRFILFKRTDSAGHWNIFDTARNTYNATDLALYPSLSNAETSQGTTGNLNDILSNGFKLRGTGADANASGGTYIFAAFAEFPFQYARAR